MSTFPDVVLTNPWPTGFVSATDMFNNVTAELNLLVPRVLDTGWIALTLGNSWVATGGSFQTPQYRVKAGVVYLGGIMQSGTTATTAFTLPVGARPAHPLDMMAQSSTGAAVINISAAGLFVVGAYFGGGSNAYVSLNSVAPFIAEQ